MCSARRTSLRTLDGAFCIPELIELSFGLGVRDLRGLRGLRNRPGMGPWIRRWTKSGPEGSSDFLRGSSGDGWPLVATVGAGDGARSMPVEFFRVVGGTSHPMAALCRPVGWVRRSEVDFVPGSSQGARSGGGISASGSQGSRTWRWNFGVGTCSGPPGEVTKSRTDDGRGDPRPRFLGEPRRMRRAT